MKLTTKNTYFAFFMDSLTDDQKKEYREMSMYQQMEWYINFLEKHYRHEPKKCFVHSPDKNGTCLTCNQKVEY